VRISLRKKVGILFQPKIQASGDLAGELEKVVKDLGATAWVCSSWDEERATEFIDGTELLICLGGDGTMLRAARIVNQSSVPILGVNLGRIGFMTELSAEEALGQVPALIEGDGWIEERAMLAAELVSADSSPLYALNDVLVARGERCRLIRIKTSVDGEFVTTYKCDGVIVATATGSTGYSLAAGGPILHPNAHEILVKPIAAHLSSNAAMVLPSDSTIELEVNTTHDARLSLDGQIETPLDDGSVIRVRRSPYVTRLIRIKRPALFYGTLMQRLEKRE
jgi:NAD+ kinase